MAHWNRGFSHEKLLFSSSLCKRLPEGIKIIMWLSHTALQFSPCLIPLIDLILSCGKLNSYLLGSPNREYGYHISEDRSLDSPIAIASQDCSTRCLRDLLGRAMGKSELPSGKHTKNYGKEKPPLFNYLEVRQIKELSTGPFSSSQTLSLPGRV